MLFKDDGLKLNRRKHCSICLGSLHAMIFAETDFSGRNSSFEYRVSELHTWLGSADAKVGAPFKIGDADGMEKAEQRQTVSCVVFAISFRP